MNVYLRDDAGVLFPVMRDVKAGDIPELISKAEKLDRDLAKQYQVQRTPITCAAVSV
jgi:hypothetical protein